MTAAPHSILEAVGCLPLGRVIDIRSNDLPEVAMQARRMVCQIRDDAERAGVDPRPWVDHRDAGRVQVVAVGGQGGRMSTPITLPGTIPSLLRVGASAVLPNGVRGIVIELRYKLSDQTQLGTVLVADPFARAVHWADPKTVAVDLSDPTSRVHAAWWVCGQGGSITEEEHTVLLMARNGVNINTQGQEQLRDMVLKRVKASPSPDKQPGAL